MEFSSEKFTNVYGDVRGGMFIINNELNSINNLTSLITEELQKKNFATRKKNPTQLFFVIVVVISAICTAD